MSALKIYADAVKEDFPELTPIVDNMLMMANARIAELEADLEEARRERDQYFNEIVHLENGESV